MSAGDDAIGLRRATASELNAVGLPADPFRPITPFATPLRDALASLGGAPTRRRPDYDTSAEHTAFDAGYAAAKTALADLLERLRDHIDGFHGECHCIRELDAALGVVE